MGRQFPPAGGTGSAVRRANGRGVPRLRISALRYPLMGLRRVRNRQFGTTVRRDAPRGNAPLRLSNTRRTTMPTFWQNEPKVRMLVLAERTRELHGAQNPRRARRLRHGAASRV